MKGYIEAWGKALETILVAFKVFINIYKHPPTEGK